MKADVFHGVGDIRRVRDATDGEQLDGRRAARLKVAIDRAAVAA